MEQKSAIHKMRTLERERVPRGQSSQETTPRQPSLMPGGRPLTASGTMAGTSAHSRDDGRGRDLRQLAYMEQEHGAADLRHIRAHDGWVPQGKDAWGKREQEGR
ncbi:MAG: hypothetical protein MZV63_15515 [Marinilabiliales bacterium]|nr:hypothetical protein [Marinilabiliales bacterium]